SSRPPESRLICRCPRSRNSSRRSAPNDRVRSAPPTPDRDCRRSHSCARVQQLPDRPGDRAGGRRQFRQAGPRPESLPTRPAQRQGIMASVRNSLNRIARQYGVEVLDVRIKRTDLPDGAPLDAAFDRMRTAREQEARSILAQGGKQAQIIRAQADADAAKIYAASFGKDPEFYDFYRAMQSYQATFVGDGQDKVAPTTIILSPQNDYLKEF